MKRRIKRKVFMMGMAVSATLPIGTTAKAGGKADHEAHPYSGWSGAQLTVPVDLAEPSPRDMNLLARLKSLVGGAAYSADAATAYGRDKGWRMELMQNEPAADPVGEVRQARDKRFGLALRMSF